MTNTEFSNEFDILYNSIATNAAPDIDLYEKSVYLTKAQEELIKNYFNPQGNKYNDGFENSSKRRSDLSQLVKGYNSVFNTTINNNFIEYALSDDSKFFKIPKETFLIVQEKGILLSEDECLNGKKISVVPKTHDEINSIIGSPFRKPDKKTIYRLDFNNEGLNYQVVELINPYDIKVYKIRYIKYPSPIILSDLSTEFPGEGLSINNETIETPCKLNNSIHREILDRAIELALADYKPELLNIKTQINNRNE